ncbi:MAG TPA: M13 family metallopeptidase [Polyangia bacterium]
MTVRHLSIVLVFAAACTQHSAPSTAPAAPPDAASSAAAATPPSGIDLAGMDKSVAPGDDFFAYANGSWLKTAEIPPDRSSYGVGAILDELMNKRTQELITSPANASAPAGSEAKKIGDYYASFLDEDAIEKKGLAPLSPTLDRIAAIKDAASLATYLGTTLRADVDVLNNTNFDTDNLFGLWVAQDLSDPSRYSPFLLQGGLGMPDRDYYLDPSARMADIRTKYQAHIAAVLGDAGIADGAAKAPRIFDLEKRIAQAHATRVESEDVQKGNNHWKRSELAKRAPGLDWAAFLTAAGLDKQDTFVVWQPKAFTGMSALVRSVPLATWKDYLAYHAVDHYAGLLPKRFVDEGFAFYGKVITGTPKLRDRWKRAVAATDHALGEAVGKLYVEKYFPPSEKARAEAMVKNILAAFAKRIDKLEWMAPATKEKAKAKLSALKVGVGYPDKWRDYSALEIVRGDAFGNAQRASMFEYERNLAKLGKPVDRGEWVMNPHLVNAVNLPAMNALNFPAAILQPPFFDPKRAEVMDYGAADSVIGHEISHSFDDQGALFDATGRLQNWWTKEDFAHFKAAAEKLQKQFDAYKPFPDAHVNGKLTSSENIADVAGLSAAYDAYRLSLDGKEAPEAQGLSGDQQFFLSFTQSWRTKIREAAARARLLTDGHAPAEYRGETVRNLDPWYVAFAVKPGQKLYLSADERVRVW